MTRSSRMSHLKSTGNLLCLSVLVALLALPPVTASAKPKRGGANVTAKVGKGSTATKKMKSNKLHDPAITGTYVVGGTKVSARVEGGSTGDGPNNDADCAEFANDINHSLDEMEDALLDGDDAAASAWSGIANTVTDMGMDGGCFFTGVE